MTKNGAHSPKELAHTIIANSPVVLHTLGNIVDWPLAWANEIMPLAAKAHRGLKIGPRYTVIGPQGSHPQWNITKAPTNYDNLARDTVEDQLTAGGYRLAQLLMTIWP